MNTSKFASLAALGLCLSLAACSGGGSDDAAASITVLSVVQDLGLDPDGTTTVVTLSEPMASIDESRFEADGGQTALTATVAGDEVTVTWDERVTPSHEVRIAGVAAVVPAFVAVETSDDSQPTFTITDAQQTPGLGGDTITVQFAGPRVVEAEAEDPDNWTLTVNGADLDLGGSVLSLVPATQVLTITTGTMANLHATFDLAATALHSVADVQLATAAVAGAASGDTTAPSLVSAEQNLAADEFGRVVDFTFDEAMDPVFAAAVGNFVGTAPDLALSVDQPSDEVLRVTFNNPIVPGVDDVGLENLIDAHGNAFVDQVTAIAAGSTVANDWAVDPELVTVSNAGGDTLTIELVQAIDPDDAEDFTHWTLEVDGAPYDLSGATFDYALTAKTLVITLATDVPTGDAFHLEGAAGDPPLDVDGQDFLAVFDGTITGDATAPTLQSAVQNRIVDPTGATLDVTFDEDLDQGLAENAANWSCSSANVVTATLLADGNTVRLELDDLAVPGSDTFDATALADLAGNLIADVLGAALTSTDLRRPEGDTAVASAIEGSDDDTLVVTFTDAMVESEVEDPDNWAVESPAGTVLDVSAATVDWDELTRTATLLFGAGTDIDLQAGDDFQVGWTTMRDIAGNVVLSDVLAGDVEAESTLPWIASAWVETAAQNVLHVRFSEPCQAADDVAGLTEYAVRTSGGALKGTAGTAVADADRMGVELTFAFAIVPASDVLDLSGVLDACGNPLFAVEGAAIEAEDPAELALDAGASSFTTVSGERNDFVSVVFDRKPSPWTLLDPSHYALDDSGTPIDLANASFGYDGALTVTITLDGPDDLALSTGTSYTITVTGLQSAQGVAMSGPSADTAAAAGDAVAPTLPVGSVKLDASSTTDTVLIELDEAIDPADAVNEALITLNGAINPDSAVAAGYRTIRATFSGGVAVGDTVAVDVRDLAGNLAALARAVSAEDVAGPLVVSVAGTAVSGAGGDFVEVVFNKELELVSGLASSNYTLQNGVTVIDLSQAALTWDSGSRTVTIGLPAGAELDPAAGITVGVADVVDLAGLVMSPANSVGGAVGGDATPPDFSAGFANYREDAGGTAIDVLFDEDVDEAFASNPLNWSVSGGVTWVMAAERWSGRFWRLTLSAPLAVGESLELVGLPDLAGNLSGAISLAPIL
jgi:hypothetical protein